MYRTWPNRLTAQQSNPFWEKKGNQCSAQHQAAWKLPWTNTSGGLRSFSISFSGSPENPFWKITSMFRPEGSLWKRRDCPCFSSYGTPILQSLVRTAWGLILILVQGTLRMLKVPREAAMIVSTKKTLPALLFYHSDSPIVF